MLYVPKFCCNCGEKITEQGFNLLSSRRFCALCQTEFQLQDWMPRVGMIFLAIFGFWGIGSAFLAKPAKMPTVATRQNEVSAAPRPAIKADTNADTALNRDQLKPNALKGADASANSRQEVVQNNAVTQTAPVLGSAESAEPEQYYCGAATKKGTPCTRKVKGQVRCWQHTGQQSLLKQNELKVR